MIEEMNPTPVVKPEKVQAITIITLVSGILNILFGLSVTFLIIIGTLGIGLLCSPLTILPAVLGVFEVISAAKLMGNPARKFNVQTIAILEIIAIVGGSLTSWIAGILNLVFYNDPQTKSYIDSLPR